MTTPLFPSVIAWNVLDGGTDAQDGNAYPGPNLQEYAAAVVEAGSVPPKYLGSRISDMTGGAGETVVNLTTPANGSWVTSAIGRFGTTRKITIPDASTNGTVQITAPSGKYFARVNSQTSVIVLLYLESCNSTDQLIVTISDDAVAPGTMTDAISTTIALNTNKAPGFWYAAIDIGQMVGSMTLPANVNGVRVRVGRQSGGSQTVVHVCGVYFNTRSKPAILIDFDDAFVSQYTDAFPIMQSYGLVGSVAVIAEAVGQSAGGLDTFNYCSLAQLQEMNSAGWAMLTHGYYAHNGSPLNSAATVLADMLSNQTYVRDNFSGRGYLHYVLPAGQQIVPGTDAALSATGMLSCRSTIGEQTVEMPWGIDNPYRMFGTPISATAGLADMKAKFDRALKNGWTIRMQGHRIVGTVVDAGNELLQAEFEEFCAYIAPAVKAGEIDNLTVPEWWDRRMQSLTA